MAVTAVQSDTLGALLRGDRGEFVRLSAVLAAEEDEWQGYGELVAATFFVAVRMRFPKPPDAAGLATFIATARARSIAAAQQIDPRVAEDLVRAVHGDARIDGLDPGAVFDAQSGLLMSLVKDAALDAAGVTALIEDGRAFVESATAPG